MSASTLNLTPGSTKPYQHEKAPPPDQSWLAQAEAIADGNEMLLKVFGVLGYGGSRQVAARCALALYEHLCAERVEEDREFGAQGASPFPMSERHDLI